jgi:hypothetical protein
MTGMLHPNKLKKQVRFQVLTAASIKISVLWIAVLCRAMSPDDGGSKHL